MKININQRVRLRLTESGKDVYQSYLDSFPPLPSLKGRQVPDVLEIPLWEMAQIFGRVMFNGQVMAPFFESNELEILPGM